MKNNNYLEFGHLNDNELIRDNDSIGLRLAHFGSNNRSDKVSDSVVISHFNRIKMLREAIRSVLAQKMPKNKLLDLIVVDDCSSQDIAPIMDEFHMHPCFSMVSLAKNHGNESLPQNVGIHFSKGKRVSFLDSDDEYIGIDAIATMNRFLNDHPQTVMACSNIVAQIRLDLKNTPMEWLLDEFCSITCPVSGLNDAFEYRVRRHKEYSAFELFTHPYYSGLRMMNRDALYRVGGWPEELGSADDVGMILYMDQIGSIKPINEDLYLWKIHGANDDAQGYAPEIATAIRQCVLDNIKDRNITYEKLKKKCSREFWQRYDFQQHEIES